MLPEYRLINTFAEKIKPKTGLILRSYGVNNNLPKGYQFKNHVANFSASFKIIKTQEDIISIEDARFLMISILDGFLHEINSNLEVRDLLDFHPFTSNLINLTIYFEDKNGIDLGTGISTVYFFNGNLEYERYEIHEYRSRYPSIGKHFKVHKESYQQALDLVNKQGGIMDLGL